MINGLAPATTYDVVASAHRRARFLAGRLRTLAVAGRPAPVPVRHRERRAHRRNALRGAGTDPRRPDKPAPDGRASLIPVRALRAAIDEAAAWGAELIVAKGDLTTARRPRRSPRRRPAPGHQPRAASRRSSATTTTRWGSTSGPSWRAEGLAVPWQPRARDLPGVRLVLVNTAHGDPRYHRGQLPPEMSRADRRRWPRESPGPAWVGLHHPPEMSPVPDRLPAGFPFGESRQFLDALAAARACDLRDLRPPPPEPALRLRPARGERGRLHQGLPGRVGRLQGLRRRPHPGRTADLATRRHQLDRGDPPGDERPVAPVVAGPLRRPLLHRGLARPPDRPKWPPEQALQARSLRAAQPLDPGFDGGQALLGRGVQELGLFVEVGGGFDAEVAAGQPARHKLQGGQQLFEGRARPAARQPRTDLGSKLSTHG